MQEEEIEVTQIDTPLKTPPDEENTETKTSKTFGKGGFSKDEKRKQLEGKRKKNGRQKKKGEEISRIGQIRHLRGYSQVDTDT